MKSKHSFHNLLAKEKATTRMKGTAESPFSLISLDATTHRELIIRADGDCS